MQRGRCITRATYRAGSPTFTADLAPAVVTLGLDRRPGLFHATNSGVTTWWAFVRAVLAEAGTGLYFGLLDRLGPDGTPVTVPPRGELTEL